MATINANDVKVDFEFTRDSHGMYDIAIGDDGDVVPVYSFDTAILMSLLTDRRADRSEVFLAARRSGWVGNENSTVPGFEVGSKLWLLWNTARMNSTTRNAIVDAARDALSWLVPNFANDLDITGKLDPEGIVLTITVVRKSGKIDKLYFRLWELTGVAA